MYCWGPTFSLFSIQCRGEDLFWMHYIGYIWVSILGHTIWLWLFSYTSRRKYIGRSYSELMRFHYYFWDYSAIYWSIWATLLSPSRAPPPLPRAFHSRLMDTTNREEFIRISTWSSPTQASTSNTSTAWPGTAGRASHRVYSIHPCCTIYASSCHYWSSSYTPCSTSCTSSITGLYHYIWLRVSWHGIIIQNTQRHTRRSIPEDKRHPSSAGSTFYYSWPAYCYP